jgi:polyhydroxyalkanoate synthesis regulator phasin
MVESLVERGEMTTTEARQTLDELLRQAGVAPDGSGSTTREPERPIEIRVEAVEPAETAPTAAQSEADLQTLRDEIARLRNELERLEGQEP